MTRAEQEARARPRSSPAARTAWALGAVALLVYVVSILWR